jgi:hypothetical protein
MVVTVVMLWSPLPTCETVSASSRWSPMDDITEGPVLVRREGNIGFGLTLAEPGAAGRASAGQGLTAGGTPETPGPA